MSGTVIWITGLPCSGKSSLARELAARLRTRRPSVVVLDGDELRDAIAPDLGYSLADRRECGFRYARLAVLLAGQDALVIVATLSMFDEIRAWTRASSPRYLEVLLRAPESLRRERDRRGLFARDSVVGIDLPFEEPRHPHVLVEDDGSRTPAEHAARVERELLAIPDRTSTRGCAG